MRVYIIGNDGITLELLASQAVISLENARLYRDLAEREARIRRLVDADIIGILIFTLDGQIVEANEAFLRMIGYDRADLVAGRLRWTELTPPEWRDRDARTAARSRSCGHYGQSRTSPSKADGTRSRMPASTRGPPDARSRCGMAGTPM
jgi:PAS domain S-box-containing protein